MSAPRPAARVAGMRDSVIRDMTRLALAHGAINLSQGFPDFDPPRPIVEAAKAAIDGGDNQYAPSWGHPPLRERLAAQYRQWLGWDVDPARHVTVTCGVTEGLCSVLLATLDPGDEVLVPEPAHDNYRPACELADAVPVAVPLEPPEHRLDPDRLAAAITPRTRAVLLNTPHNPTGRVVDGGELAALAELVIGRDLLLVTDEIYDRLVYDGRHHVCPGSLEALRDRTVTISGLGKTFAVTGWRLGYVVAPDRLAVAVRTAHDYLTICAPTPLQVAACAALDLPAEYYAGLVAEYDERRGRLLGILDEVGFTAAPPEGAYYVLGGYRDLPVPQAGLDPTEFAKWLTVEVGVAVVPGTAAHSQPGRGEDVVRFAFCKRLETLDAAGDRLRAVLAR
jgi:aspartate/methionine/tyrosine aminotransferase